MTRSLRTLCFVALFSVALPLAAYGEVSASAPAETTAAGASRTAAPPPELTALYDGRLLRWLQRGRLTSSGHVALTLLRQSSAHGLAGERYALPELLQRARVLPRGAIHFDRHLSAALLAYCIDLLHGGMATGEKGAVNAAWQEPDSLQHGDLQRGLARAIARGELAHFVAALTPQEPAYRRLQLALRRYRTIEATGGWPQVAPGDTLAPGSEGPRVRTLRLRLLRSADLPIGQPLHDRFDAPLERAVARFQRRHGLQPDGRAGRRTLAALNRSAADKIAQIELNLDRWRQLPRTLPADLVMVNIPGYRLDLRLHGRHALDMPVVVGKASTPTPLMAEQLEQIVFHPYWYPPTRLTAQELYPRIKTDPGYLTREGFEVLAPDREGALLPASATQQITRLAASWDGRGALPFRLRQQPGPKNALGRVKFLLPNRQAVYLHDTPDKALFDQPQRAYSHGCVRVAEPARLAAALLARDQAWDKSRVARALTDPARKAVELRRPVAVFLVYFTVDLNGTEVRFFPDVYGRDKASPMPLPTPQIARLATALQHPG